MLRSRCLRVRTRGFTLIELSIVILVVALLLGSILVPLNAQVNQRNVQETQRILEDTREALIGYAMANGRLPRPAQSHSVGTESTTACDAPNPNDKCLGYVPWAVLGTPRTDAWGKLIRYSVTPAFTSDTTPITLATAGNKRVNTRNAGTDAILADELVAVLISHGPKNWGTTADGISIPDSPVDNDDEDANATNDGQSGSPFWSRTASDNAAAAGGEFDDVVVWLSKPNLVTRLVAAGRLP